MSWNSHSKRHSFTSPATYRYAQALQSRHGTQAEESGVFRRASLLKSPSHERTPKKSESGKFASSAPLSLEKCRSRKAFGRTANCSNRKRADLKPLGRSCFNHFRRSVYHRHTGLYRGHSVNLGLDRRVAAGRFLDHRLTDYIELVGRQFARIAVPQ